MYLKPNFFLPSDIDECTTKTDNCDVNAACTNTVGSHVCACKFGSSGDGITCYGNFRHIKLKVREDMFIVISFYVSCMYMKTGVLCGLYVLHDIYLLFSFIYFNCNNSVISIIIRFYQT